MTKCISNLSAAGLVLIAIMCANLVHAADDGRSQPLLEKYDAVLLEKLRKYRGSLKDLMNKDMLSIARQSATEVFSNNYGGSDWTVLKRFGDNRLSQMPKRPADKYAGTPAFTKYTDGEIAVGLRVAGIGTRAAMRLWDPESVIDTFSQMAFGSFMDAEKLAFNTVVTGMLSKERFVTRWRGHPAIGADRGFWTVVIAYERDSQGSLLPLAVGIFER